MKQFVIFFYCLIYLLPANAQQYTPVDDSSKVEFTIKNFGINTTGNFKGLNGTISFSPDSLFSSLFNININANTVNTGIEERDNHLKKEEYFNVNKYANINFNANKITSDNVNTGTYLITGSLTIKGITKEVSFPFKVAQQPNGTIFTGTFQVNRQDFKVGKKSMVLSDNVEIKLRVFAKKS